MNLRKFLSAFIVLALIALYLPADNATARHPHFSKKISMKLGDVETELTYFTAPANMEHVKGVKSGAFNAGFATLKLGGDVKIGDQTLKAGEYTVGAVKNGDNDWTMGVHFGRLGFGATPDESKVTKLKSSFSTEHGNAAHIYFDIMPGHGDTEGKTVLIWHFGPYLSLIHI